MGAVYAHYFVQLQGKLDAEEPGNVEPEKSIDDAQTATVTFVSYGRKVFSTAAAGVAPCRSA
jgi:hypothetical protein